MLQNGLLPVKKEEPIEGKDSSQHNQLHFSHVLYYSQTLSPPSPFWKHSPSSTKTNVDQMRIESYVYHHASVRPWSLTGKSALTVEFIEEEPQFDVKPDITQLCEHFCFHLVLAQVTSAKRFNRVHQSPFKMLLLTTHKAFGAIKVIWVQLILLWCLPITTIRISRVGSRRIPNQVEAKAGIWRRYLFASVQLDAENSRLMPVNRPSWKKIKDEPLDWLE